MVELIRRRVREHTGIAEERIMVSATHTHTGGPVKDGFAGKLDEAYTRFLSLQAADAAILAYRSRREARIGFGRGHEAEIAFNRRFFMKDGSVRTNPGIGNPDIDRPEGPIDPEVLVVRIDDANGRPIGVISNYALHLDTVGGSLNSGDYAGEISRIVKRTLGSDVVSLFLLGACGNINHVDTSGRIPRRADHYLFLGQVLAGEILKVHAKINTSQTGRPDVRQTVFPLDYRVPTEEQLEWARGIRRQEAAGKVDAAMANQLFSLAEDGGPTRRDIEIQTIRLGELAIVGVPGELFVEFGLQLKAASPFPFTLINELANGSGNGYICTRAAFAGGGYEPRLTTSSRWPEETGERMVEEALRLLAQWQTADPKEAS